MPTAIECRHNAAEERKRSELSNLPNVRRQHERSAEKWDHLADMIDHCCRGMVQAKGMERDLFH